MTQDFSAIQFSVWQVVSMIATSEKKLRNMCLEFLRYDSANGKLFWKKQRGRSIAGSEAGHISRGYVTIRIDGQLYQASRIIWLIVFGKWPKYQIDHENHNSLDNRISNLKDITQQQNLRNMKLKRNNTSGVCGVYFQKSRNMWAAFIRDKNSKIISLGRFKCFDDAVSARKKSEKEMGYHPNHGVKI